MVIRLIIPLRMNYEESYAKGFPFDKMAAGMLDPEMVEDSASKHAHKKRHPYRRATIAW